MSHNVINILSSITGARTMDIHMQIMNQDLDPKPFKNKLKWIIELNTKLKIMKFLKEMTLGVAMTF